MRIAETLTVMILGRVWQINVAVRRARRCGVITIIAALAASCSHVPETTDPSTDYDVVVVNAADGVVSGGAHVNPVTYTVTFTGRGTVLIPVTIDVWSTIVSFGVWDASEIDQRRKYLVELLSAVVGGGVGDLLTDGGLRPIVIHEGDGVSQSVIDDDDDGSAIPIRLDPSTNGRVLARVTCLEAEAFQDVDLLSLWIRYEER